MLSKILFSLVCFLLPIILFGQNGSGSYKIDYEMTFQKDSNEAQLTTELSELLVNKDKSLFRTQVQATRDTLRYHKDLISSAFSYEPTSAKYRIVKNYKQGNINNYEVIAPLTPGLIVSIADKTGSWSFRLLHIQNVPAFNFDLYFLENSTELDPVSFYKRKRHYRDNAPQINEAAGRVAFPTEEFRQYTYRSNKIQAKKDNNWIELNP